MNDTLYVNDKKILSLSTEIVRKSCGINNDNNDLENNGLIDELIGIKRFIESNRL